MPILAIDKFGRYYETDPDSSEGEGCKGVTPMATTGDVSFDGSISSADAFRQRDRYETNAGFAAIDAREEAAAANENQLRINRNIRAEEANFNAHRPENMKRLVNTGIAQSKMLNSVVAGNVGLSGNGMTSNGMVGKAGMGRQEMGAQIALGLSIFKRPDGSLVMPQASQVSVPDNSPYADQAAITDSSVMEQQQHKLRQQVEKQIAADAMKQAKINALEAKAAGYSQDEEGEYIDWMSLQREPTGVPRGKAIQSMTYSEAKNSLPEQTQKVIHPMFLIFLIQKPQGA